VAKRHSDLFFDPDTDTDPDPDFIRFPLSFSFRQTFSVWVSTAAQRAAKTHHAVVRWHCGCDTILFSQLGSRHYTGFIRDTHFIDPLPRPARAEAGFARLARFAWPACVTATAALYRDVCARNG
jgi:hypothetical protein